MRMLNIIKYKNFESQEEDNELKKCLVNMCISKKKS